MSQFAWMFQGGKLKTITIAATAGNVVTNNTPGTGKRWLILYGRITIVCDGSAANRKFIVDITDGTNILNRLPGQNTAITASQTKTMSLNRATSNGFDTVAQDLIHHMIGDNMILEGADEFRITVENGVAGDSYSGYIRVLEIDTP